MFLSERLRSRYPYSEGLCRQAVSNTPSIDTPTVLHYLLRSDSGLTGIQFWYEVTVGAFPVQGRLVVVVLVTVIVADPYLPSGSADVAIVSPG